MWGGRDTYILVESIITIRPPIIIPTSSQILHTHRYKNGINIPHLGKLVRHLLRPVDLGKNFQGRDHVRYGWRERVVGSVACVCVEGGVVAKVCECSRDAVKEVCNWGWGVAGVEG